MRKPIHYFRFGMIEGRGYAWKEGYCQVTLNGYLVPAMGKREAQSDAKHKGGKAVFHESEHLARQAMRIDKHIEETE
jgi:hypothetical protein